MLLVLDSDDNKIHPKHCLAYHITVSWAYFFIGPFVIVGCGSPASLDIGINGE